MTLAADIFDRVFLLIRDFERNFREQGDAELSTTQYQALAILAEAEPVTAMAMAGLLRIAGPTATRTLDSLERRELVVKERDPQDRRVVWLRITEAGRSALAQQMERQRLWMEHILDPLTDADRAHLHDILEKLGL